METADSRTDASSFVSKVETGHFTSGNLSFAQRRQTLMAARRRLGAAAAANQALHRIVGRSYAAGDATPQEAARALGMSLTDLVVFLESHGYQRTPEVVSLDAEDRANALERICATRGRPRSEHWIARDTVASQRIEGIDARSVL